MQWNEFPCLDFIDSRFRDHTGSGFIFDRLALAEWQQAFLDHWGWSAPVPAPRGKVAALRELRSQLRRILESASAGKSLQPRDVRYFNSLLGAAPFVYTVTGGQPTATKPIHQNWDWIIAELVRSAADLITRFEASRIKVCANPDCSWIFYDLTLNRSRRWCLTRICGNLVKVRAHRASLNRNHRRRPARNLG
jgi:predicted RNA-binding Zn ribbon-like protein